LQADPGLVLWVECDGVGMPVRPESNGGPGLRIMRNRVAIIGASLNIGPAEPAGTVVFRRLVRGETSAGTRKTSSAGPSSSGTHPAVRQALAVRVEKKGHPSFLMDVPSRVGAAPRRRIRRCNLSGDLRTPLFPQRAQLLLRNQSAACSSAAATSARRPADDCGSGRKPVIRSPTCLDRRCGDRSSVSGQLRAGRRTREWSYVSSVVRPIAPRRKCVHPAFAARPAANVRFTLSPAPRSRACGGG